jgi:prepilin-type N-terminal cleavage/methylation domain-containing protein
MARVSDCRGFTLVETMIAVILLGLLLAVALPDYAASNRRRRAEAAALEMSTCLQITRQRSVATRTPFRIVLDTGEQTY